MIKELVDDLIVDEGFVRHAYKDSEGYYTIGIGRLVDGRLGGGISMDEAKYLLSNDVSQSMKELDRNFPWWRKMSENRQRALINMCFNLGIVRLTKFRNMLAALRSKDYDKAADEALDSKWARQVGDRSLRIAKLIREG